MSNWLKQTIGDLINKGVIEPPMDGNHGEKHPKGSDFVNCGIPFIMASDINNGIIDFHNCKFITQKQADSLRKGFSINGDVLLTHKATIGRTAIVSNIKYPYLMLSPQVTYYRIKNHDFLSNIFLKYYFDSKPFQETIGLWAGAGSTRAYLGITGQHNLTIRIPDIDTQRKISTVLSRLDTKINLNNRINVELEAMVKQIYDYWFVQFDFPDTNGKPYKSSGGKMIYNEVLKQHIPIEWMVKSLNEITQVSKKTISPAEFTNKKFRYYSIPTFDEIGTFRFEYGAKIGSNKFTVSENDILISKLNPWFNRVIYSVEEDSQICSTEFVVWSCGSKEMKNFLYQIARNQNFINYCTQSATGTSNSHKRVNPNVMMQFKIPYKKDIVMNYGEKINDFIKKIILNKEENITLSNLRDWLLPMLMNGQVKVK
ncbi:restriction endonuclease subunit S [Legionella pneumophila]|uniref:restriction endonuclease subunit S n=1 Tax=Legionella pneumophila TaxID=446 RepID=UPI00399CF7D9